MLRYNYLFTLMSVVCWQDSPVNPRGHSQTAPTLGFSPALFILHLPWTQGDRLQDISSQVPAMHFFNFLVDGNDIGMQTNLRTELIEYTTYLYQDLQLYRHLEPTAWDCKVCCWSRGVGRRPLQENSSHFLCLLWVIDKHRLIECYSWK